VRRSFAALVAVSCAVASPGGTSIAERPIQRALPRVIIETGLGEIEVEVDSVRAPVTAANFLRYVDGRLYDGGRFHRTVTPSNQPTNAVKIEVVQAGIDTARRREGFGRIPLERTSVTGLSHTDGTISMARGGPDTATSDFFICIGDQPSLDFGGSRNADGQGFAAFGKVVRGMEVVRRIQGAPAEGQTLRPPVRIARARRAA
jgi:peptidyl-prolyl cis-trans isomerase A (cyclophilin A)